MEDERIPVSMVEFNSPGFPEKRKRKEEEGYEFDRSLSGCGFAATMSTEGAKHPGIVILAGHFVRKKK